MKKFTPHILILIVGFVSLALMASNALAQQSKCEHLHQLSKKLNKQVSEATCTTCVCEKMEVLRIKHHIEASILQDCDCDETNDKECGYDHGHPSSDTGEFENRGCIWEGGSKGIPGDSLFIANITRVVKYCKDNDDLAGFAWPRAGYHFGTWRIVDSLTSRKLANGKLEGCDGVDPSYERPYALLTPWVDGSGEELESRDSARKAHHNLPGGQDCSHEFGDEDACDGSECYLPGWQVGCITGGTTTQFFCYQCPPPNTYTKTEIDNISQCTTGCVTQVFPGLEDKQICVVPTDEWKIKACYSGKNCINPDLNPCEQWGEDWSVRLEGVIAIRACSGGGAFVQ